jgi:putative ABC transport system substrate-binding protein
LDADRNPLKALEPIIKYNDMFLALPDQARVARATAKWALHLAYRYRKPVIGFSEKYLQAGAIASLYSSPQNFARQTAELLPSILSESSNGDPLYYPRYFTVGLNPRVAANLKITLANDIQQQLQASEQGADND